MSDRQTTRETLEEEQKRKRREAGAAFGQRVATLRTLKGIGLSELSRQAGYLTPQGLRNVEEKGAMPLADAAVRIAQALGTTVEHLVNGDGESMDSSAKKATHSRAAGTRSPGTPARRAP